MVTRLLSFVIWAAVAGSAMYWALRLLTQAEPVPLHASVAANRVAAGADLAPLFGAAAVPAEVNSAEPMAAVPGLEGRLKLLGVVAPTNASSRQGLALISVDGKPARAVAAGALVDGELRVLSVGHRRVELGPHGGPVQLALDLAPLPEAARGVPPGSAMASGAATPQAATPARLSAVPMNRPPFQPSGPAPNLAPGADAANMDGRPEQR